jgi:hypothetical protein
MLQNHSFPASFGRSLSQRLDRLGDTLAELRERMRAAISHAIGVAAADAVRSVTHALLGNRTASPTSSSRPWASDSRLSLWDDPDGIPSDPRFDHLTEEEEDDDLLDPEPLPKPTQPARTRNALAVGCAGAVWWLRRGTGRCYLLATLGIGLLCMTGAYLVGSQLAGSILNLTALADLMRSGTSLLGRIGTS